MEFTTEGKAAIKTILKCLQEADDAFRSLSDVENHACFDYHNEGASLNHCTRWGLQAAEDIHTKVCGSTPETIYTYKPNRSDSGINGSEIVKQLDGALKLAQKNYQRVNRAWLGATAAKLFVENPWIESFRATLGSNDIDIVVGDVKERKDYPLPDEVTTNGSFDFEDANLFINEELLWHEVDAASAFNKSSEVFVYRSRVEKLLCKKLISGEEVFELLFPEEFAD